MSSTAAAAPFFWYAGVVSGPNALTLPYDDPRWVTPVVEIFYTGLQSFYAHVWFITPKSSVSLPAGEHDHRDDVDKPRCYVTLVEALPVQVAIGHVIFVRLVMPDEATARTDTTGFPSAVGGTSLPGSVDNTTATSYPPMPGEGRPPNFLAIGSAASFLNAEDSLASGPSVALPSTSLYESSFKAGRGECFSTDNGVGPFLGGFFPFFAISCAAVVANSEISMAIAQTGTNWLLVLIWLILGNLVFVVIVYAALFFILSCVKNYEHVGNCVLAAVLLYFFCIAVCIPYAWAHAQLTSTQGYLDNDMTQSVNCWRTANLSVASFPTYPNGTLKQPLQSTVPFPITPVSANYVFLTEASWVVDTRLDQVKSVTIAKQNDDGVFIPGSYRFCAAPLRYTGTSPCGAYSNLYAMCYAESTTATPGDCTAPAPCGWNYPPNGIFLRVVNTNEEFFRVAESPEEQTSLQNALQKTTLNANAVGVAYAGDPDPSQMDDKQGEMESLVAALRGVIYGVWFTLSFIMALSHEKEWDWDTFGSLCVCCCCICSALAD